MTPARVAALLALWMTAWLVPGCAQRSLCTDDPGTCSVKLTGLSASLSSLTDQGGLLVVQIDYQQAPPDLTQIEVPSLILISSGMTASVNLTQGTNHVPISGAMLSQSGDKGVSIALTAAQVKPLTAGPVSVSVTIGTLGTVSGTFSFSKRLPFGPAITSATVNSPVWVGIHVANNGVPGDVVTVEQFTNMTVMQVQRQISAYSFTTNAIQGSERSVYPMSQPLAQQAISSVAGDWAVVYTGTASPLLQAWNIIDGTLSGATTPAANRITAMAASPTLVAALTDTGLQAYGFSSGGTFGMAVHVVDAVHANPGSPALLGVGDLDGDTLPDLVAITQATPQVTLVFLQRTGQLTYDAGYSQALATTLGSTTVSQMAVGNLDPNNGGLADLAVASGATVRLIQNLGTVSFASVSVNTLTAAAEVDGIAIGDVNADGKNDLALCNTAGKSVSVMLNQSN